MFKKTKKEKELDTFINTQTVKPHKSEKELSQLLSHKRERDNNDSLNNDNEKDENKNKPFVVIQKTLTVKEQIEKIFQIANKQNSLIKCVKLIKMAIIKTYNENSSLLDLIILLKQIDRLPFKVSDLSIDSTIYRDIYQHAYDEIVSKHKQKESKETNINNRNKYFLDIIDAFKISFVLMSQLFTDDSFIFNASIKQINEALLSLPDYSIDEKDFDTLFFKKDTNNNDDMELNLISLKRTLLFECYESMVNCKTQMKTSTIQSYSKLMINKAKLSPKQQSRLNELIKNMKENNYNNNTQRNALNNLDSKTKSNPLDSYYEVNDAREEKYVLSHLNKWESKQNGIDSTKKYLG